ncbi:MAG TPA: 4Fe-4S dicluster domain-containing protein [Candidatus Aveggerthella stercoripullorum]|uniref:4Fe-4S dicluster domain-containing protein n=1 Tax=Candidatus Aveggerthella stercoripullorum TaxID=2840688 RepID=A0A9D1A226_9ACTN|nr:4Fe-4S dicluster domain-containing protein [Candidatus Aveggerthella stercoripullorum]
MTQETKPEEAGTNPSRQAESASPKPASAQGGISRRTLCLGVGGAAVMLGLGGLKFVGTAPITRPPGGQDDDHLASACIRCQKCVEICPRHCITPAHGETGLLNLRTPTMDFHEDYCDWCREENGGEPLCVKVCPTQALKLPAGATEENTIIGKAVIDEDTCLAFRLTGCRFCYDACIEARGEDKKAIELDENNRPHVTADLCNGCGACESVCVSLQNGSISSGARERAIVIRPLETVEG